MNSFNLKNSFLCPQCSSTLTFNDAIFISYFLSKDITCPECHNDLNLWNVFIDRLDLAHISYGGHYSLLGCESRIDEIIIKPNESTLIDLREEIGKGDLLYVNFTIEGGNKVTVPMYNISAQFSQFFKYKSISLFGVPKNEDSDESKTGIFYWFAPEEVKKDLANMLILDAFKFYYEENYRYMIISAHSAAEILLSKFIEKLLKENGVGNKKADNFIKHAATHSHRLHTLLPFVCETMGFPKLDNQIHEGLENLRRDRNDLIHYGETDTSDKEKLKRELIAAFFAFKYFKIIHNVK